MGVLCARGLCVHAVCHGVHAQARTHILRSAAISARHVPTPLSRRRLTAHIAFSMAVPQDKVDAVRERLSTAIMSGPDATAARRTLKSLCKQDPTIEANEANVKLVVALKACRVGNLNLDTFKNFKNVLEIRETVEQKMYIIEKAARPDLDKTEGFMGFGEESWLHHPDSVSTSVEKGALLVHRSGMHTFTQGCFSHQSEREYCSRRKRCWRGDPWLENCWSQRQPSGRGARSWGSG